MTIVGFFQEKRRLKGGNSERATENHFKVQDFLEFAFDKYVSGKHVSLVICSELASHSA